MFVSNKILTQASMEKRETPNYISLKMIGLMLVPQVLSSFVYIAIQSIFPEIAHKTTETIFSLFATSLSILSVILYTTRVEKFSLRSLGMIKENRLKQYLAGSLIGIIMIGLVFVINYMLGAIEVSFNTENFNLMLIILFFIGYLFQGMSEEVLLRSFGMTLWTLEGNGSVVYGILMNSFVFAGLHLFNPGITVLSFANLVLFGIFASLLYYLCENIWIVGALHSLWNFTQGLIFGVLVSGTSNEASFFKTVSIEAQALINGGSFGFEGGLVCTGVLAVSIWVCIRLLIQKNLLTFKTKSKKESDD